MENTEAVNLAKLGEALAKAQGAMRSAKKDAENPHFRSRYADLASIWDAIRAPLADNGLSVIQRVSTAQDGVTVRTTLLHSSGESVSDDCWLPVAQQTPQAFGSAITYARRYSLSALVGVAADEDDDGNAASAGASTKRFSPPPESGKKAAPSQASAKDVRAAKPGPIADVKSGESEDAAKARLARAHRIWTSAGKTRDQFAMFVGATLGGHVASKDWTDEHMAKLEAALAPPASAEPPEGVPLPSP